MDYYRRRRYGSIEYPGYDPAWVLGQGSGATSDPDDYYYPSSYAPSQYYPRSRSGYYPHSHYEMSGGAQLAWPTEIPTKLRMTICCEGCRNELNEALRDLQGVHDVGIVGWSDAMVTVTGTAAPHKILKVAWKISKSAQLWTDPSNQYRYGIIN